MRELMPCPFCGDDNPQEVIEGENGDCLIQCRLCQARGPICAELGNARKTWNRRQFVQDRSR